MWAPVLPEQRKVTDGKVDPKPSVSANGAMRTDFAQLQTVAHPTV